MKKMLLLIILFIGACVTVQADTDEISVDFTADFMTKYVWRGQCLNDDYVFQPGVAIGFGNFTVGIWGNMELTSYHGERNEFTEVDYSLDYTDKFFDLFDGKLNYSVGIIYYDFPNSKSKNVNQTYTPDPAVGRTSGAADTTEIYWGFSYDCFLNPTVTVYHDIDEAEGTYASFGISHSIDNICEIGDASVGMEMGASIGYASASYNKYYWGPEQGKVNDLTTSISFPIAMGTWTVSPSLHYVTLLTNDIRNQDTYRDESDYFFAGVSIGKSF